jgi:hypothetical protein
LPKELRDTINESLQNSKQKGEIDGTTYFETKFFITDNQLKGDLGKQVKKKSVVDSFMKKYQEAPSKLSREDLDE